MRGRMLMCEYPTSAGCTMAVANQLGHAGKAGVGGEHTTSGPATRL